MATSLVIPEELRERSSNAPVRLAYLLSRYPAVSHTFLLNEITTLRKLKFDIATASINTCDPLAARSEIEREEVQNTFYVKGAGVGRALWVFAGAAIRHPLQLLRGLRFTIRLGGSWIRFFYFVEAVLIGQWMRARGNSHLHAHFGCAVSTVAMIVARTFPVTMSLTIHGPDEFYDVRKFYLARKIETASFVLCIGTFARSQMMMLAPASQWSKLLVSPLGVDAKKFAPPRRGKATGYVEIACVGRLVGAKGQHVLLAAFHQLSRQRRNARLRLIGDGPDRRNLETFCAEAGLESMVDFVGAVEPDRVRFILENADIFALPSFAEGIPVALMEAMAMEIPCVSTAITGIPELIRSEVDGILVPPGDQEQLAAALERLIDDPDLREQLGQAGRRRVLNNFDLHRNVANLAEVFRCRL
jgi:colanic acid/amylovoran biosynthesis glycosyltransferase